MAKTGGVLLAALLAFGCEPTDDVDELPTPECAPGEMAVFGTVNEVSLNPSLSFGDHVDQLGETPGYVEVRDTDGSLLVRIEVAGPVAVGQTAPATGFVDLSFLDVPRVGNCPDDGLVSRVTRLETGVEFRLADVRPDPFCGDAEPTSVVGCANWAAAPQTEE